MRPRRLIPALVLLLLPACAGDPPAPPTAAPAPVSPGATVGAPTAAPTTPAAPTAAAPAAAPAAGRLEAGAPTVLATGLEAPWGLAFLPDGAALIAERDTRRLVRVAPDGGTRLVDVVEEAQPQGEGGLLGIALSPAYASDGLVYAYYTTAEDNRVARFRLGDVPEPVLTGIPAAGNHNGGRITFGPDGMLWVATGDASERGAAPDPSSLAGKILRVTPDGEPAPGNPVAGSAVWSSGHRNVQGLAFDDADRLWATEFGQDTFDEVNRVERGADHGWPEVEGRGTAGGRYAAPQVVWSTDEASPSGVAYAGGSLWVAALRGRRLWQVPLTDGEAGEPRALLEGDYGRLRTVAVEPGGRALWVLTSNRDGRGDPTGDDDRVLRVPLA